MESKTKRAMALYNQGYTVREAARAVDASEELVRKTLRGIRLKAENRCPHCGAPKAKRDEASNEQKAA
jgi:transposase-like protein